MDLDGSSEGAMCVKKVALADMNLLKACLMEVEESHTVPRDWMIIRQDCHKLN